MNTIINIWVIIGILSAMSLALTFIIGWGTIYLIQLYGERQAKLILKIVKTINIIIITTAAVLIILALTNWNPRASIDDSNITQAPLPSAFEPPTVEKVQEINNQPTRGESRREKMKREAEENQKKLLELARSQIQKTNEEK